MHHQPDHTSSDSANLQSLSSLYKSKLDKAQARRLKMPKRNRSAYFLFSMDTRAKIKTELGNSLTPLEMQAKVSQYWKELSAEEKEKYEARAREEKNEYLVAMEKFYSNLTPETLAKSKSNRPKKPCSAYAHFVRDIKLSLKKDNPRLIMQEILHIASDKWKNLPEATRVVYEERAKIDKDQYMIATKKLLPENQESPKRKNTSSPVSEKPGKRALKINEACPEETISKQVKVEASCSIRSEANADSENALYKLTKIEEHQDTPVTSVSPITGKIELEAAQEGLDKIRIPSFKAEGLLAPLKLSYGQERLPSIEIPKLNTNVNVLQSLAALSEAEKVRELMLANLSWASAIQANKSLEETICRKILEVRQLQNQRLLMAQKMFLAANTGTF